MVILRGQNSQFLRNAKWAGDKKIKIKIKNWCAAAAAGLRQHVPVIPNKITPLPGFTTLLLSVMGPSNANASQATHYWNWDSFPSPPGDLHTRWLKGILIRSGPSSFIRYWIPKLWVLTRGTCRTVKRYCWSHTESASMLDILNGNRSAGNRMNGKWNLRGI